MKLSTNWIENDGRSPGLMLAHAHGWGTILDVELRDGTVELSMPAWMYEFALTCGPKDVLRYRINVEPDLGAMRRDGMSAAQHSTAPWSFQACRSDSSLYQLLRADGRVIGHLFRGTGGRAEAAELEANARLVAAAPGLLAALAELASAADGVIQEGGSLRIDGACSWLGRARAAIAAAEGSQKEQEAA